MLWVTLHLIHAERQLDLMSFYNKCLMYTVYKTNRCTLYACGEKKGFHWTENYTV